MHNTRLSAASRVALLAVASLALSASASAPKRHEIDKSTHLDEPVDRTWSAVIEVFADRNWPIEEMEKDSGLVTTDWMKIENDSPYADCGGAGIASVVARMVRLNVLVRDDDGSSRVTVNASFREIRTVDGSQVFPVDCVSTGKVERLIHRRVERVLDRTAGTIARPKEEPNVDPEPTAPADGTEGGACYGNQTCNVGLICNASTRVCDPTAADDSADGQLGGPCYGNRTCNAGLVCDTTTARCIHSNGSSGVPR